MARIALALAALAAVVGITAAVLARGSAAAPGTPTTIQRTFVSTGGSDANPCTRVEPCRNFAAAIAATTAGGEVIALDSGGYGPFIVQKPLTVAGAPGVHAAVTVFDKGIDVVVPFPGDTVVLRNLYLTGLGRATGINFAGGGVLHVESTTATGFTSYGLFADATGATLFIRDSAFRDNATGVYVDGAVRVEISGSRADGNSLGFGFVNGARASIVRSGAAGNVGSGYLFAEGTVATIAGSTASGNLHGVATHDVDTSVTLDGVVLSNNNIGLLLGSSGPTARIGGSTVSGNVIGLFNNGAGALETFGDNVVRDNATDTDGTLSVVGMT